MSARLWANEAANYEPELRIVEVTVLLVFWGLRVQGFTLHGLGRRFRASGLGRYSTRACKQGPRDVRLHVLGLEGSKTGHLGFMDQQLWSSGFDLDLGRSRVSFKLG